VRAAREITGHAAPPAPPGTPAGKEPAAPRAPHPALTWAEQQALLAALDSDRFADKAPAQVYAILLYEGIYLASIRTMYRVMTLADQVRERRAQAQHPPRVRPELVADGPDQVWTWDITKLKGPWRGTYFDLYVMLDIFSRKQHS
jgi:putative transposase